MLIIIIAKQFNDDVILKRTEKNVLFIYYMYINRNISYPLMKFKYERKKVQAVNKNAVCFLMQCHTVRHSKER